MKPERNSHRLFGITRSKEKMYELGLREDLHLRVPEGSEPEELFLLCVGILGDVAASIGELDYVAFGTNSESGEIGFAASFFDAFLESRFNTSILNDTLLLASSAYYLSGRPGSSLVLAKQLNERSSPVERMLRWVLLANWEQFPSEVDILFGDRLAKLAETIAYHFHDGYELDGIQDQLRDLRDHAYRYASPRELLFIDVLSAIIRLRARSSTWVTLPQFTGVDPAVWSSSIRRPEFPKELWPSQMRLGQAGLFGGSSGVVQMPTSSGKTRSVEIILRGGFYSGRTNLAVVVAPFRALSHEIATSLSHAFRNEDVKVNELTDAIQLDFVESLSLLLGADFSSERFILVVTPEKLLYILRQTPDLARHIGIVVYDEGHQFDSGKRGITYELLLTELKSLLSAEAQTVLISAVIQNARAIGEWLIGDEVEIVDGKGLLTTARSVAFASWIENLGQLMFFEGDDYSQYDYFVPRIIEQQPLEKKKNERKLRLFPERGSSTDIALYLGLRLASEGAVAIFCGRKDTASNIAVRASEIYEREYSVIPPKAKADTDEIRRLANLLDLHYGTNSNLSEAARLGIFVHHGNTPQGVRLSVEYAMQQGLVRFVACTSTLAQGVNLPIRYLIVAGVYQGKEKIKVRDFQNLVGRAGRSGIHTEGLVIFSDPAVFDGRFKREDSWRYDTSVELLSPDRAEATSSSLLGLLDPFWTTDGKAYLQLSGEDLSQLLLRYSEHWSEWAESVEAANPQFRFKSSEIVKELRVRRQLLHSIESYLMANRGEEEFEGFNKRAAKLAKSTLAYHLASEDQKQSLVDIFESITLYIHENVAEPTKQAVYAKTLLGVNSASEIEDWVEQNRQRLLALDSNDRWLDAIWELFVQQSDARMFHNIEPKSAAIEITRLWISGKAFHELFGYSRTINATKPWGKKRRALTEDDVIAFCEQTLGFDCSLVVAAVTQFLFGEQFMTSDEAAALRLFQKSLKYGLPTNFTISCYESGFADRVLAQALSDAILQIDQSFDKFSNAIEPNRSIVDRVLRDFPSYFSSVLASRT